MKLKNRLIVIQLNVFVVGLCLAIIIAIPLQLLDYMLTGKNSILKTLENKIFKTLFYINDIKTHQKNEQ